MEDLDKFVKLLDALFPTEALAPLQLRRGRALQRVLAGETLETISKETKFTKSYLKTWSAALADGHFYKWLGKKPPVEERLKRARAGIAQMALGFAAENHFEQSASGLLEQVGFTISDERPGATDTDYFLLDNEQRPVCRINVKYHGTLFRQSQEYVGLDPEDCFALATYKIDGALKRQSDEAVPYAFLIATVPGSPRSFVDFVQMIQEKGVREIAIRLDRGEI